MPEECGSDTACIRRNRDRARRIAELKIKHLRARAKQTLGDKFDVREFHDILVQNGAIPLGVL